MNVHEGAIAKQKAIELSHGIGRVKESDRGGHGLHEMHRVGRMRLLGDSY